MKTQSKNHPDSQGLRTWIEIDTKAMKHNYDLLRGLLSPKTKMMAVVKSNAYGHSLIDFSQEMERLGADWFGVDSILEGQALRKAGIKAPILVLGYTLPSKIETAAEENISITVSTFETLEEITELTKGGKLSDFSKNLSIHIKVDTGMHRQGFMLNQIEEAVSKLKSLPENIKIEGLFTHFAAAKNPAFPARTLVQIEQFEVWIKAFKQAGFSPIIHAAASGGAIVFPQSHYDMVRLGIVIYGLWPSAQVRGFAQKDLPLKPVMTWKAVVGEVKIVPKGESVGYDFTETLKRDSKLAIVPVGYWHGLPRLLSSVSDVLIGGKRARMVGRVSMDMITLDVTDIPGVKVGDVVTILGQDGDDRISPKEIADQSETSEYEIITRTNPLIKKIFV